MNEKTAKLMETNKKLIKQNEKHIVNEAQSRKNMLDLAEKQGCKGEAQAILDRTDKLLYNCSNLIERKHITVMAVAELHRLLNVQGGLSVDGVEVIPPNN
jgi:hypothetical protein